MAYELRLSPPRTGNEKGPDLLSLIRDEMDKLGFTATNIQTRTLRSGRTQYEQYELQTIRRCEHRLNASGRRSKFLSQDDWRSLNQEMTRLLNHQQGIDTFRIKSAFGVIRPYGPPAP